MSVVHITRTMRPLLKQLERNLRDCGPSGLLLLGNVLNALNRDLPYHIYVDSLTSFKAGLAKSPLTPDVSRIDEVYTLYAQNPGYLENLLMKMDINWDKRLLFKPVHHSWVEVLKGTTSKYGTLKSIYPRDSPFLMFASNPQDTVPMEVPKAAGYYLDVLHTSHASLLASQWGEFIQDGCVEYLASQIQHGTSLAAYQNTTEECSTLPSPSNHSSV